MQRKLSPAVRRLLSHCFAAGGSWLACDSAKFFLSTLEKAERDGWVSLERDPGGTPVCAVLTDKAKAELGFRLFVPSGDGFARQEFGLGSKEASGEEVG